MRQFLAKDGEYEIYVIQIKLGEEWEDANLDSFGSPNFFKTNDRCFKTLGINGTFHSPIAEDVLKRVRIKFPEKKFRLVKMKISQTTQILSV